MSEPVVDVAHAAVGYDGRPVLRDVSLTVTAGEVVAVLGADLPVVVDADGLTLAATPAVHRASASDWVRSLIR